MCECKGLNVELVTDNIIDVTLDLGSNGGSEKYPPYSGSYTAVPKTEDQVFPTFKTSMENDFTVNKITYLETPNVGGGLTITIGEI